MDCLEFWIIFCKSVSKSSLDFEAMFAQVFLASFGSLARPISCRAWSVCIDQAYLAFVCFVVAGFGCSYMDDSGLIVTIWVNDPSFLGFWVDDLGW